MTLSTRQPKPKKCAVQTCRTPFVPAKGFQTWCSTDCAIVIANEKLARKHARERKSIEQRERREIKVRREKLKSRADHLKDCQAAFNAYIRLRDAHLPCVSCGRPATWDGQWHASHYRSVGSTPALRFDPRNVHRACSICNSHLSGNIMGYRPELVRRVGEEVVLWIEGPHDPQKWTVDEIKAKTAEFRAKVRELKRGTAA